MRKIIFILILLTISNTQREMFAQSSNMYLLRNLNAHGTGNSACWGYTAPNGREYAILGCMNGTAFIDITDSANIHEVAFKTGISSGWREMKVYSHYCYVVSEAVPSGLQIFDLAYLPNSVHHVSTYFFAGFSRAHTISQSGPYLYINGGDYINGGVFVLDVTNPEMPVRRGQWETDYIHDCRVRNDTIWSCNISTGKVTVISAVNRDSLRTIASFLNIPAPNAPHNCDLSTDGKYLFVTDEVVGPPSGILKIWNVEDLSNVVQVATWGLSGTQTIHNIEIYGTQAVIAYYGKGVRVLNISNPLNPVEIAYYVTSFCWGVYKFASGKIIASDGNFGLYVLKVGAPFGIAPISTEIPNQFSLSQNYPNPFNPVTSFKLQVSSLKHVKILVFDVLGREVATLVNEQLSPGTYEVDWDGSNFSSGVYYYILQTEGYTETKKMILIK